MYSVREKIDAAPVSRYQIYILFLVILCNLAEGYDVLSISFAAVPLSEDWGLSGTQLGFLLSSGPIGMAIGSILLGSLADRIGRRPLLIGSLALISIFMFLSGFAQNLTQLAGFRMIASIGMGGVLPVLTAITGEFAPARKRSSAIALTSIGIPVGGMLGGVAAALLTAEHGWRSVFFLGASMSAIVFVLVCLTLPETPDYLQSRKTPHAQRKLDKLLTRMNITDDLVVPALDSTSTPTRSPAAEVAAGGHARIRSATMALVAVAFALAAAMYYFANLWLPKLLVNAGMSQSQGISGGLLLTLGATIGTVVLAVMATRVSSFRISVGSLILTALLFGVFALVSSHLGSALFVAAALGMFLNIGYTAMFAIVTILFAADTRSTALGVALTAGRLGAIAIPSLVGILLDAGWTTTSLFTVMIVPIITCAGIIAYLHRGIRSRQSTVDTANAQLPPEATKV